MRRGKPNKRNFRKRPPKQQEEEHNPVAEELRLNKYLAHAGVASRRKADEFIQKGLVKVNGKVVDQPGAKVMSTDKIQFDGKYVNAEKKIYVLLNKPKGFITTTDDDKGRRTVMDLISGVSKKAKLPYEPRLYPVGRLDRETTGLLLFTNDGDLSQALTHPSMSVTKVYKVNLGKNLSTKHFEAIERGVDLEDGHMKVDEIAFPDEENRKEIGIKVHSGKNRIVRRLFEHFGYEVVHLDRMLYADLTKKDLPRGKWRFLHGKEVIRLKYLNKKKTDGEE